MSCVIRPGQRWRDVGASERIVVVQDVLGFGEDDPSLVVYDDGRGSSTSMVAGLFQERFEPV